MNTIAPPRATLAAADAEPARPGYLMLKEDEVLELRAQLEAIDATRAIIQFETDGTILHANELFLQAMGYELQDIVGKSHRIFVDPAYGASPAWAEHWAALARGEVASGEFQRFKRDGSEIWIEATYTPIRDASGRIYKIIKYASDVTPRRRTVLEIMRLIEAVRDGQLEERAETSGVDGDNLVMRESVNAMLDAIEAPVRDAAHAMAALARQDLTARIDSEYRGVFEELATSVNSALGGLGDSMRSVREAAEVCRSSALELSGSNVQLSSRTEQQAANLEETASAMEQMLSSVQQTASNARSADERAAEARRAAETGGVVIESAVQSMREISASSDRISEIIVVIDEIAFQTNLLALNASVEAARAGYHGRGFAVVADEVRNLAGRCAVAAREIKTLIEDSASKVAAGSAQVNRSGETLREIVEAVSRVGAMVGEISLATQEQTGGIGNVNASIQQMDEVTQQNAAMVEEAAANSEQLSSQAEQLEQLVSSFVVE